MIREEKIEFIYKKIADKTLNFWCSFKYKDKDFTEFRICCIKEGWWIINWIEWWYLKEAFRENFINNTIIIWHPVMIWDVMAYFNEKLYQTLNKTWWVWKYYWVNERIIILWFGRMRRPIEEQSDDCIDYIYDLLQKE